MPIRTICGSAPETDRVSLIMPSNVHLHQSFQDFEIPSQITEKKLLCFVGLHMWSFSWSKWYWYHILYRTRLSPVCVIDKIFFFFFWGWGHWTSWVKKKKTTKQNKKHLASRNFNSFLYCLHIVKQMVGFKSNLMCYFQSMKLLAYATFNFNNYVYLTTFHHVPNLDYFPHQVYFLEKTKKGVSE